MKKLLLPIAAILTAYCANAQCTDLFISEYVEGWSNNKAIEIYNPTNSPFDMIGYSLVRFRNQSPDSSNHTYLSGIIPPYGTYVVVIDKRDTAGTGFEAPVWDELQAKADTFVNPVYNSGMEVMYFNGDDAIVLFKNNGTAIADIFGKIADLANPDGWGPYGTGQYISQDHTLIRKASVLQGVTLNPSTFDIKLEWDSLPANTFDTLGFHTCDCNPTSVNELWTENQIKIYPNPFKTYLNISSIHRIELVEVYNVLGKAVYSQQVRNKQSKYQIPLYDKSSGVYFLKIHFKDGTMITKKIVK